MKSLLFHDHSDHVGCHARNNEGCDHLCCCARNNDGCGCAEGSRFVSGRWLLYLLLMIGLLTSWATRVPARLIAEDAARWDSLQGVLEKANQAIAERRWRVADECIEEAIGSVGQAQLPALLQQRRWCNANIAVEDRYCDDSFVNAINTISASDAQSLLVETVGLIERRYYQRIDSVELFDKALLQLLATARRVTPGDFDSAVATHLSSFTEEVERIRRAAIEGGFTSLSDTIVLSHHLADFAQNAGLGHGWPALALSYAIADSLDEYSHVLSPRHYRSFRDQLSGSYVGVGVDLMFDDRYPLVFDVVAGSPAATGGVKAGDMILRIDNEEVADSPSAYVSKLLSGRSGSCVTLTVRRGEKEFKTTLTRNLVVAPSVRQTRLVGPDGGIGYLRIAVFDNDTAMEVRRAIDTLADRGARALIVDLRNNGGGILDAAVDTSSLFVDRGTIVTVMADGNETVYLSQGNNLRGCGMPIAVLVNEATASAAEIFTAALQDHHRAIIIGQVTRGKGVVQTIYGLREARHGLCLTTASFTPPSGRSFHKTGITPDITVDLPGSVLTSAVSVTAMLSESDATLAHALTVFGESEQL